MTYRTPHHSWPMPSDGEDEPSDGSDGPLSSVDSTNNWGDLLQTTVDELDSEVIIKDTAANQPTAGESGRWFLATDDKYLEYDDGSSWVTIYDPTAFTADIGTSTGRTNLFKSRPLVSESDTKVDVPGDYSTIQDALEDAPMFLKHRYTIRLDPTAGTYDEDIVVPPVWAHDVNQGPSSNQSGPNNGIFIFGDPNSDGSRSEIKSGFVLNPIGYFGVRIDGCQFNQDTPYSDDAAGLAIYGGAGLPLVSDTDFDGPTQGLLAYGPRVIVDNLSIASNVDYGIRAKRGGHVFAKRVSGSTTLYATGGHAAKIELEDTTTGSSKVHAKDGGHIIDNDNAKIYMSGGTIT